GDFAGASAVLVEGTGVTAEVLPTKAADVHAAKAKMSRGRASGSARFKLTARADAMPGVREIRLATPQGVSSVWLVVVTDEPVVTEADDKANNTPGGAQKLSLPVAVSGKIGAVEDVDCFAFDAKAGQTIAFALWGNRLENKIHDLQTHLDPILILTDAKGRELASDDNHDFADPRLIHTFQEGGAYQIQVRDTNYAGNANWTYVLHATGGPHVAAVFPMAVNPGTTAELAGEGVNFDGGKPLRLDVPADARPGSRWYPLVSDKGRTQPVPVVVTRLPVVKESGDAGEETGKAQAVTLPAAICGRLGARSDADAYRFGAKKGQVYGFEVVSRRAGSALDPILRVLDEAGKVVSETDDTPGFGKDPRVEWTAPGDGDFSVQVADLHNRGGAESGYVLLADAARPDFVATCDPDKFNIGPGARTAVFVKAMRRGGFEGPVSFAFEGLPAGVSASPLTIPYGMTQGVIVISAASDARLSSAFVTLMAKADTAGGPLSHEVGPTQEIYLPGGGRGLFPVETLAVGVTNPSDIMVEAKPLEVVIKPGE
ncbi:MAG TPA: pre-peptidase, partial [Isosphaeraceae bacterium]